MSRLSGDNPAKDEKTSTLDDCIQQIVCANGPRLVEENALMMKMAASFSKEFITRVRLSSATWRRYTALPDASQLGETTVLYKQDFATYVCHVYLKRPTRMAAFVFKSGRLPSVYGEVKVNPRDSREQQMSVLHEWLECSDKFGNLRSDLILKWFNKDLIKVKRAMEEEQNDWSVTHLVTANGNVLLTVTMRQDKAKPCSPSSKCFNIIFIPCLNWVKVAGNELCLPTSPNEPFPTMKRRILRVSKRDARKDRCSTILEASCQKHKHNPALWRLCYVKYDMEISKILDNHMFQKEMLERTDVQPFLKQRARNTNTIPHDFSSFALKDLTLVMESLALTVPDCLSALTKEVIQQAILNLLVNLQYKKPSRADVFLTLVRYLENSFRTGYMRKSLVPSINVLKDMEFFEMKRTAKSLNTVLRDIQANPELLLAYVDMCSQH